MLVKFERLEPTNEDQKLLRGLPNEDLSSIEQDYINMPLQSSGNYGPIKWDTDFHFDPKDITKSYAYIKVAVMGINIINGRLDTNNPNIAVNLSVAGVGVKANVGIDFSKRRVFFKGTLNFILYKTDYDLTIFSF